MAEQHPRATPHEAGDFPDCSPLMCGHSTPEADIDALLAEYNYKVVIEQLQARIAEGSISVPGVLAATCAVGGPLVGAAIFGYKAWRLR